MEVYADKLGITNEEPQSDPAYWGLAIEPLVLARFAKEHPHRKVSEAQALLAHDDHDWMRATLDGQQEAEDHPGPGLLEVKCTSLGWRWSDEIPPYVDAQLMHQFAVTGWEWGSLAVLFNGREYRHRDIFPDAEKIARLFEIEKDFWERLSAGEPPEADGSESCAAALRAMYPKAHEGEIITLADSFMEFHTELLAAKADEKEAKERKRNAENHIRKAMGDAETAHIGATEVSYTNKLQDRPGFFTKETSFRVLRSRGGE